MTTTSTPSTKTLAVAEEVFTDAERVALAGLLAGYRGLTRDTYALDLRQFVSWCEQPWAEAFLGPSLGHRALRPAPRGDRPSSGHCRPPAVHSGRLLPLRRRGGPGAYVSGSPCPAAAARLRVPRDRPRPQRGRRPFVAAGLGAPSEHALISLLALNGLRVSEAVGANIEALGLERGHRALIVLRKGGKMVTIPLAPRTASAVDLAIGERLSGPIFIGPDGRRFDRHTAGRIVRRVARRAGVENRLGLTLCDTPSSPRSMLGCRYEMYKRLPRTLIPRTTMRYDRARVSLDRHTTYIVATYVAGASR